MVHINRFQIWEKWIGAFGVFCDQRINLLLEGKIFFLSVWKLFVVLFCGLGFILVGAKLAF